MIKYYFASDGDKLYLDSLDENSEIPENFVRWYQEGDIFKYSVLKIEPERIYEPNQCHSTV